MTGTRGRPRLALVVVALTVLGCPFVGCGGRSRDGPGSGERPGECVLEFLEAAAGGDRVRARNLADPDSLREDDAGFRDTILTLRAWSSPNLLREAPLDSDRVAVDVESELEGGGGVTGIFVAVRSPDGAWRVSAVFAPDADWPRRQAASKEGLSISPPPR